MTDKDKKYITTAMAGWSADSGMLKRVLEYIDNMVESGVYRGHTKGFRKGYATGFDDGMGRGWLAAQGDD